MSVEGKMDGKIMCSPTDFGILPIPRWLRYDPQKPFHFGLMLNISFGLASTIVVANLYYCQPLLIELSKSFNVTYREVSAIPTLVQAGYVLGLLLISPLGDLVRRRQLTLLVLFISTLLTIGLSTTSNLRVFEALCFLIGVVNVTPQILMPLAADQATPERRGTALSIVFSGIMLGILVARVLAGIIGNFSSWRVVYCVAIGLQFLVLVGVYFTLPDYPAKNKDLTYFEILYTMAKYAVTEPLVVQVALINIASSACFTAFWVTLTFLLGGSPYYYSTLAIGLFGLVGIFGVLSGPLSGRLIDKLVPWYASFIATFILLVFQSVQTAAGGVSVAAVAIACFGLDAARQMQQVSLSTAVLSISITARARLNAILILSYFIGQVMGTIVGTRVFIQHGWRACSWLMFALYAFQLVLLLLRGPHCPRYHWFGWAGGFEARISVMETRKRGEEREKGDSTSGATTQTPTETPTNESKSPEKTEQDSKQIAAVNHAAKTV